MVLFLQILVGLFLLTCTFMMGYRKGFSDCGDYYQMTLDILFKKYPDVSGPFVRSMHEAHLELCDGVEDE